MSSKLKIDMLPDIDGNSTSPIYMYCTLLLEILYIPLQNTENKNSIEIIIQNKRFK